jgi:hypothetical protein
MITSARVQFATSNALGYQPVEHVQVIMTVQMGYIVIQIQNGHILVLAKFIEVRELIVKMITNVLMTCFAGISQHQTLPTIKRFV